MIRNFSSEEREKLILQYIEEEPLFQYLQPIMENIDDSLSGQKRTSFIENWNDAKDFVLSIYKSKHPDRLVKVFVDKLINKSLSFGSAERYADPYSFDSFYQLSEWQSQCEYTIVLIYAMAIVHFIKEVDHSVQNNETECKLIEYCNDYRFSNAFDSIMVAVEDFIESDDFSTIYNYTTGIYSGESGEQSETKQLKGADERYQIGITFRILSQLLSAAGVPDSCNKKVAAQLMHRLTNGSAQSFQNMYSNLKKYPLSDTQRVNDEIDEANTLLKGLGLNFTINKE